MEADLRTYVLAQAGVSAITSRMYLLRAPQGAARPLIVYSLVRGEAEHTLDGYCGLTNDTIEIDCQSETDVGAKALKEAVRLILDGYRGTMGSTAVRYCRLVDEGDDYTPPQAASDKGIYHATLSFEAWHTEPNPTV